MPPPNLSLASELPTGAVAPFAMHLTRCDLALALAPFRRRPGTAAILVTLLALACALTTVNLSLFAFLHSRPLPYPNHARIAWIGQASRVRRHPAGDRQTLDNAFFLQSALNEIERIATVSPWHNETLRHGDSTETLNGWWITPGFFELLGVRPALGATFEPAAIAATPRPLLISDRLAGIAVGSTFAVLGTPALIAVDNLSALERAVTPAIAAATIVAGAVLGALAPALRALTANPVPLLRSEA